MVKAALHSPPYSGRYAMTLIHPSVPASARQQAATQIVDRLRAAGHAAYFAGGCVRDLLLGREPLDFDVATSATPEQVLAMFPRTFAVGAQFGVVLVVDDLRRQRKF